MSGIYGIFHRDGRPVDRSTMELMRPSMALWGPKGCQIRLQGPAGLGRAHSHSLPEAPGEDLPRVEASDGRVWTAIARLDNRSELDRLLQIPPSDRARWPDADSLLRAYRQWGEDCPIHLHGDWSLAAWHPASRHRAAVQIALGKGGSDRRLGFHPCKVQPKEALKLR